MLSSRASSIGNKEHRRGGFEVVLTPSVLRRQIVSLGSKNIIWAFIMTAYQGYLITGN